MSTSLIVALCCLGVMLLFFLVWRKQFNILRKMSALFFIVYLIGVIAFFAIAIFSVAKAEDPNFDYLRNVLMITTAASCIWYGAWCSQYKMDEEEGIARKN